jgi:hypothetical protein
MIDWLVVVPTRAMARSRMVGWGSCWVVWVLRVRSLGNDLVHVRTACFKESGEINVIQDLGKGEIFCATSGVAL